jgi:hypothetical protein
MYIVLSGVRFFEHVNLLFARLTEGLLKDLDRQFVTVYKLTVNINTTPVKMVSKFTQKWVNFISNA